MKSFILRLCLVVVSLFLLSCEGWDETWRLDTLWSEEISILNNEKSKKQIDRIAIIRSKKRRTYTVLSDVMEQKPFIINERDRIDSLINSISSNSEVNNVSCSINDYKYFPFHIITFDSSTMRTAYIMLLPCDDGKHSTVLNYSGAGIYRIKTPSMLNAENHQGNRYKKGEQNNEISGTDKGHSNE
jgi:hypothetical protein